MQFVLELNRVIDLTLNHPERFPTKHLENSMRAGSPLPVLNIFPHRG